jgi:hypothetical protein
MKQVKGVLLTTLLGIALASAAIGWQSSFQPVTVKLIPSVIRMGTFYGGAKVRVEGVVPS